MAQLEIDVNTARLKTDVTNIEVLLKNILTGEERLLELLNTLSIMWEGKAQQRFVTEVHTDLDYLHGLVHEIARFNRLADESRQEYEMCENAVLDTVKSICV